VSRYSVEGDGRKIALAAPTRAAQINQGDTILRVSDSLRDASRTGDSDQE
jgi:hypothetical protein